MHANGFFRFDVLEDTDAVLRSAVHWGEGGARAVSSVISEKESAVTRKRKSNKQSAQLTQLELTPDQTLQICSQSP